jgi:hypothetical protein
MKQHTNSAIKARLIRGAFYLLLLLAVCLIPFALAQRTTGKPSTVASAMQLPIASTHSDRAASGLPTAEFPTGGLYNQYNNPATEPPLGIGSQEFEPAMAAFNDQAADDFVLGDPPPPPLFRYINGVAVMGEYSAGGGRTMRHAYVNSYSHCNRDSNWYNDRHPYSYSCNNADGYSKRNTDTEVSANSEAQSYPTTAPVTYAYEKDIRRSIRIP